MPYTNSPILLPSNEVRMTNRSPRSSIIASQRSMRVWFNSMSQGLCNERFAAWENKKIADTAFW